MTNDEMRQQVRRAVEEAIRDVNWPGDVTTVLFEAAVAETQRHGSDWTLDRFLKEATEAWKEAERRRQERPKHDFIHRRITK